MQALITTLNRPLVAAQSWAQDLLLLGFRIYVAWVFFRSGWLKINNWSSTEYLFQYEYQVPLIPWEVAAWLGTAAELVLPIWLIFGLTTRLMALALFIFNIIAVWSYPTLWQDGFVLLAKGALDHQLWGLMLLMVVILGAGRWSVDRFLNIQ